jgi:hypothetical protein
VYMLDRTRSGRTRAAESGATFAAMFIVDSLSNVDRPACYAGKVPDQSITMRHVVD